MFIVRRILSALTPVLVIAGAEIIRSRPGLWWLALALGGLALMFTVWDFTKRKINQLYWNFLLTPLIFYLSLFSFLLFIENFLLYRLTAAAGAVMLYLFLEQILNYSYFPYKYQPYTLESFSFYINILSMFFLSIGLFGTLIFLHYNRFLVAAAGVLCICLMVYQVYWVNKINWEKSRVFAAIIPLCLAELFIALSYWPTSYYVNALILTVLFYLMVGLSRLFLLESLNFKNILNHAIITAGALAIILATAQWV